MRWAETCVVLFEPPWAAELGDLLATRAVFALNLIGPSMLERLTLLGARAVVPLPREHLRGLYEAQPVAEKAAYPTLLLREIGRAHV